MSYDLKNIKLPRLAGTALKILTVAVERAFPGKLLLPRILKDGGISAFRKLEFSERPTLMPLEAATRPATRREPDKNMLTRVSKIQNKQNGFQFISASAYREAYRKKKITPVDVAVSISRFIDESNQKNMRAIVAANYENLMQQARASTERWKKGRPLSPLDGVPVSIKEELDMIPYPSTAGTKFLGRDIVAEDATVVERLRSMGAMLIGKANMHEIGIGVTGYNAHHGIARNPYNPDHYTGGSSSGSAASVAMGLNPISIGADGGGSIRLPAALCGVYGIKATFGRVSEHGAVPLCWSVAHVGPLAATAADLALGYTAIAGPDRNDALSLKQPDVSLAALFKADALKSLKGVRIGIYDPWFHDADPEVVAACEDMLKIFTRKGAKVSAVEIPQLEAMRVAHLITIGSEMAATFEEQYRKHRTDFGTDVRLNLAIARSFTARDYVRAQRMRTRALGIFDTIYANVDVLLTPSSAVTAPPIQEDVLSGGESDLTTLSKIMRFAVSSNLTGHPAVSFPVGYDSGGLPIGMQAIGRHWEEDLLLRLCFVSEQHLQRREPVVYYNLLQS